jgi:hypothetical protein
LRRISTSQASSGTPTSKTRSPGPASWCVCQFRTTAPFVFNNLKKRAELEVPYKGYSRFVQPRSPKSFPFWWTMPYPAEPARHALTTQAQVETEPESELASSHNSARPVQVLCRTPGGSVCAAIPGSSIQDNLGYRMIFPLSSTMEATKYGLVPQLKVADSDSR